MIIDAGFTALSQQGFDELGGTYAYVKVNGTLVQHTQRNLLIIHILGSSQLTSLENDPRNWFY